MKIHAAMMCQNELTDCIDNVSLLLPFVDSLTIVDGGSVDGTIVYFRNFAKNEPKLRFFIHPWQDNFPAQRNNYLSRVREIASSDDWLLAVDPDEFLSDEALKNLRTLPGLAGRKVERYRSVAFKCISATTRASETVHTSHDEYWKTMLFSLRDAKYSHNGNTPVHEICHGVSPTYCCGHHPEVPALYYMHRKQEDVIWIRGVRNYFIGGGGPNLGTLNPRWVELKDICKSLGVHLWSDMYAMLLAGNIPATLASWIIRYRNESGWDGASEQREWYKTYFYLLHPEEEPDSLRRGRVA